MIKNFRTLSILLLLSPLSGGFANTALGMNVVGTDVIQQENDCKGVVKDSNGETIIGASVVVKGTTNGTITGLDGDFSLSNVDKGSIIQVSFVGYETIEVKWNGQPLEISLKEDTQTLDEVVVVGFGTQKKVNLTGAVSTVDTKALESRPVTQVSQALQGTVPGLNLNTSDLGGQLGQSMSVNIRGTGTIGTGSNASPLILIDGIEGNMNNLNPDDIASISVLKDAASSSIYGSRAAFGVILITTKKGKAGKMSVSYSNNFRYSGPTNLPNMLDSWRFANYFNEAAANQGDQPVFNDDTMQRIQDYMAGKITTTTIANGKNWHFHQQANDNVNWLKEHYKWAWSNEHNISLNGGTEKLQYYVSGNYLKQNGNLRYGNDEMSRYNLTAKVNTQINKFVEFNFNTKFIRFDLDNPLFSGQLLYHDITRLWPMMPLKDPNGHYMRNSRIIQLTDGGRNKTHNDNLYLQGQMILHPLKNWNIYVEAGMRVINENNQSNLNPIYEYDVDNNPVALAYADGYAPGASYAQSYFTNTNFYTTSVYTDYTLNIDNHNLKFMAGMNTEEYKYRNLSAQRDNVITPDVPEIGASVGEDKINYAQVNDWATAGFFGRINYAYNDKYLVEVNVRYDGSSRFLRDQRWNLFPSFSLGWNAARESFFEPINNIVNTLKPRFSWGMLGNQNTSSYYPFYLSQSVSPNGGSWLMNGSRPTVAGAPGVVSSTLTWENIYNTNVGFDFGLFNNRLTGYFEYYIRETKDMVGPPAEIGAALGIGLPNTNNAILDNRGWDLQVNWQDRIGEVNYNVGFNLSDNRVKVTKYPNESLSLNTYFNGMILGDIWGYETHGIAKSQAEMDAWLAENDQSKLGSQWGEGDVMYKDLNGDGVVDNGNNTYDNHGDIKVIGNSNPRFRFGLNLGANWKGWDFSMFLQGVMKRDLWLSGTMFWGADGGIWQSTAFEEHLDYYRPEDTSSIFGPNTDAYYPKAYMGDKGSKNKYTQTGYLQSGAYMRLKNIQLGYTFPQQWMSKLHVQKLRVYVSGENLFTISGIADQFDPEATGGMSSGKTYPLSKTISFGLNLTL